MYAFSDPQKNRITVSQLLTAYKGQKNVTEQIKAFFPTELIQQLFMYKSITNTSNVRRGDAYNRFKECAIILTDEVYTDRLVQEMLESWNLHWTDIEAFDGDERNIRIFRAECARRILHGGERQILQKNCPELLKRLDGALKLAGSLNDDSYLQKIFTVLTILSVTRYPNARYWKKLEEKLLAIPDFLPNLQDAFEEPVTLMQKKSLDACRKFFEQDDFKSAREALKNALNNKTPIWNSAVCREWALKLLNGGDRALTQELSAISSDNSSAGKNLPAGKSLPADNSSAAEDFLRTWYPEAFFLFAEFYQSRDAKKFFAWMERGVKLEDHRAMYLKLEMLGDDSEAYKLAKTLQNSPIKQISGGAHWRLYLLTKDENHLQAAYEADFPAAVREHNRGVISYVEELKPDMSAEEYMKKFGTLERGRVMVNEMLDHHVANILVRTIPPNWGVNCGLQEHFQGTVESIFNPYYEEDEEPPPRIAYKNFTCLLIDDDPQKNLSDFLALLTNMRENPPQKSHVIIRGEIDLLTPIVDTALKQYYYEKNPPLLRVEILDDDLHAVRKLFAERPLFLPLLTKPSDTPTTLHFVTVGKSRMCSLARREANWLMTFPAELNITPKITALEPHELQNFCEHVVANDEALYFLADVGNDLQNLSLAIKIRETLTRAWISHSKADKPPFAPIAFHCRDINVAFMSRRLIVLGEEKSGGVFNNHHLTPIGLHGTWSEVVENIYSKLAVAVHMVYCDVPVNKTFDDEDYRDAFRSFSRRTYNQRSSLAAAQSLLTRTFVMSRLLGIKIFDETFLNVENLFDEPTRKKILNANPLFTELKNFYPTLLTARKKSAELRNNIELYRILDDAEKLSAILDDLLAAQEIPTLDKLKKFTDFRAFYERNFLDDDAAQILSEKLERLRSEVIKPLLDRIEKTFIWEHDRWSAYLRHSEGWLPVDAENAVRYINAGNNAHQQNFLAKLHPCIDLPWCHLQTLSENLRVALGTEKDFKTYDIKFVLATADLLAINPDA